MSILIDLMAFFQDVTQNSNWNHCLDVNGSSLARCIYHCDDNADCENTCVSKFKEDTTECPCEVGSINHTVLVKQNDVIEESGRLN